ncbi:hypothetical protein Acsp04_65290 [Actinomadura sp. NBRC 104425]|uniref:hypothetical protein n=1 Tax=Actinomadura sp. NBRC 104425 TaxID=3032204 RepID=UPI0024A4259D|nr:hypothetical protein [Actinomadura sp. NBRC 104425]GLZ16294.1 hypothetical protein Acsp04_65290 [Actinomadura sp. NBRC 104425]
MPDATAALRLQVTRQAAHWRAAVVALADFENFAAASAWANLERHLGVAIRAQLRRSVLHLQRTADVLDAELRAAETLAELDRVRRLVVRFRRRFLRVETALDFYGDAVNTRTSPKIGGLLRACDILAGRSLEQVLGPLGLPTPPVLTYVDRGLGASILRSGLRLWDGRSFSVAAAVKVTRHNLGGARPTALLHECGHQLGFSTGWNDELAAAFRREFQHDAPDVGDAWAGWSSETAADAFAFAHAGYAAVAALHDVIAGEEQRVWTVPPGDPHPPAALRVLANAAMARRFYGVGPWDDLAGSWTLTHPLRRAPDRVRGLYERSAARLPRIVDVLLLRPMRAFHGRPLVAYVDPLRVRPDELARLSHEAGTALFTSPHWLWTESLRLLALSGYRAATEPEHAADIAQQYENWMTRLGHDGRAAA